MSKIKQRPSFSFVKATDKDVRKVVNFREYDNVTRSVTEIPESYWYQKPTDVEAKRAQGLVYDEDNKITEVLVVTFVDYVSELEDEQPTS